MIEHECLNGPGYEDEEWRDIPGFTDYLISNFGRVWSIKKNKCLKPELDVDGYKRVMLYNKNGRRHYKVHRLVAGSFLIRRYGATQVNHDDGDKTYNYFENLQWVTGSENQLHAFQNGLNFRKNKQAIKIVETNEVFESLTECAKVIRGSVGNIHSCLTGRRKTHKGLTFEYVD